MLVEFSVENYKSIGEKQTLSLESYKKAASEDMTFETDNRDAPVLNKVAAIWGANASGKSSLMLALGAYFNIKNTELAKKIILKHKFDDYLTKSTRFTCKFIINDILYSHSIEWHHNIVFSEELLILESGKNKRWRTLFKRSTNIIEKNVDEILLKQNWEFPSTLLNNRVKDVLRSTLNGNSFISSLNVQTNEFFENFKLFFENYIEVEVDFGQNNLFDFFLGSNFYDFLKNINSDKKEKMLKFYNNLNLDISKIHNPDIDESGSDAEVIFKKGSSLEFFTSYSDDVSLNYHELSQGTKTVLHFSKDILYALENGGVVVFDELDSSIHSQLLEKIISMFADEKTNPKNAQLIFTTHNTNILSSGLLARDQIWFTEKNEKMQTELYSLSSFSARNDENFERGYLSGRYGAVPAIDL